MGLRTYSAADVAGKRVLVRVDFNVPMDGDAIRDDTRIRAVIPTLLDLRDKGATLVLCSHMGRPKGKPDPRNSLEPIARHLSDLLGVPVRFAPEIDPEAAGSEAAGASGSEIVLLENLRFDPGEEANSPELAKRLAGLAEVYINDAFGAAHRAHASTEGVAHLLPSFAGLLMAEEVAALTRLTDSPRAGFLALIGGAKVSDKIGVLKKLVSKVETLAIGGGMANTFLLEAGCDIGRSLAEPDALDLAREVRDAASQTGTTLLLPTDVVVANDIDAPEGTVCRADEVPAQLSIFDIGPETVASFSHAASSAVTIFWNGPMGVFEKEPFAGGTKAVAQAVAGSDAFSLVGGGDSVAAIEATGVSGDISHISTGGGASLEFIEGRTLPGLAALMDS